MITTLIVIVSLCYIFFMLYVDKKQLMISFKVLFLLKELAERRMCNVLNIYTANEKMYTQVQQTSINHGSWSLNPVNAQAFYNWEPNLPIVVCLPQNSPIG